MERIIALQTDFKISDPFIGVMKGVIYSIYPEAKIVDLGHNIRSHDVKSAAFQLLISYRYFPRGTIFCCVIDPGVGTERRGIVIDTGDYIFVGPDNGLFTYILKEKPSAKAYEIKNRNLMLPKISTTFHGRDIFAPVSAHIARGVPPSDVGPEIPVDDLVRFRVDPPRIEDGRYSAQIAMIDGFGNIMLYLPLELFREEIGAKMKILGRNKSVVGVVGRTFGDVPPQSAVILATTSHGFLELAINQGSMAEFLGVDVGDIIVLERVD